MDMASSPSSWPKDTNSSMLEGGQKQSSGKETGQWGDRWVRRQDAARRGGAHQLAAVSPTPNRPRTISRRARSTRAGRSVQYPQSNSSSAVMSRDSSKGNSQQGNKRRQTHFCSILAYFYCCFLKIHNHIHTSILDSQDCLLLSIHTHSIVFPILVHGNKQKSTLAEPTLK